MIREARTQGDPNGTKLTQLILSRLESRAPHGVCSVAPLLMAWHSGLPPPPGVPAAHFDVMSSCMTPQKRVAPMAPKARHSCRLAGYSFTIISKALP